MIPLLSERLTKLRKEKKRTQQEMADYLGITRPAFTAYELGNRQPDYEILKKLANYFEVSTDYILGQTDVRGTFQNKINKQEDTYDSLAEINKMVKEFGIEDMGFFDIDKWKNLSPEDVDEIRRHFEWVAQKAKERNEEKE